MRARRASATASRIEVIDEGPGIPDADATRVFERFYRADTARVVRPRRRRVSASRSRVGSSTCTTATSTSRRGEPHGCRMVVTLPAASTLLRPHVERDPVLAVTQPTDKGR